MSPWAPLGAGLLVMLTLVAALVVRTVRSRIRAAYDRGVVDALRPDRHAEYMAYVEGITAGYTLAKPGAAALVLKIMEDIRQSVEGFDPDSLRGDGVETDADVADVPEGVEEWTPSQRNAGHFDGSPS